MASFFLHVRSLKTSTQVSSFMLEAGCHLYEKQFMLCDWLSEESGNFTETFWAYFQAYLHDNLISPGQMTPKHLDEMTELFVMMAARDNTGLQIFQWC